MANPKLEVVISAQIEQFQKGLNQAQSQLTGFANEATSKLTRVGDAIKSVALPAGIAAAAIGAMGFNAIKAFGRLESLEKGLLAVSGSSAAATQQLDDLREVAKLPGLGLEEAVRGSINLQSIGISADVAKEAILQFGNAVATVGKGRVELDRALYGLQQLANTDTPLGEDLNIIKDAIPQVSRLLDEAFGANRSDALAKMGVTSQQVVDVILKGLGELPRVTGGVANAFENMQDAVSNAWQELGRAINETLNFEDILSGMGDALGDIVEWFKGLDSQTRKAIIYVTAGTTAFLGLLAALGAIITIAPIVFSSITLMTGGIAAITAAVGVAAFYVIKNWSAISLAIQEHNKNILNNLYKFLEAMRGVADAMGATQQYVVLTRGMAALSGASKKVADNIARTRNEIEMQAFIADAASKNAAIIAGREVEANGRITASLQGLIKERKSNLELYRLEGEMIQKMGKRYVAPVLRELPGQSTIQIGQAQVTGIISQAQAMAEDAAATFNDYFSQNIGQMIGEGIGSIAQGIGQAIGQGGNIIEAFGNSLLQTFGNFLSKFGEQLITYGIAAGAFGKLMASIATLNPATIIPSAALAVAAGAALSILGSAVASAGSGGSSIGGQGSQSQNVTSGTVVRPAYAEASNQPQTLIRGRDLVTLVEMNTKYKGR